MLSGLLILHLWANNYNKLEMNQSKGMELLWTIGVKAKCSIININYFPHLLSQGLDT